jgi:hypothetical protein
MHRTGMISVLSNKKDSLYKIKAALYQFFLNYKENGGLYRHGGFGFTVREPGSIEPV